MLDEIEIKAKYNQELKRWKKYEDFCESNKNNLEEIEKWIPQAQEMCNKLSSIINLIKEKDIKHRETELLHGFLM